MDFLELVKKRYSVRKFADKPIEEEKLAQILEAARLAPTGCNKQPQKIYVLKSDSALTKIRAITPCVFNAPTVLLFCGDTDLSWKDPFVENYHSAEMDVSIVCSFAMLEAVNLEIGSTWVLYFDPLKVIEAFDLPKNIKPYCLLPIGYPAIDSVPAEMHFQRNKLDQMATFL